jgi:hypothetical protein
VDSPNWSQSIARQAIADVQRCSRERGTDIGDRDGAAPAGDLSVLSHGDQIEHSVRVKHDILAIKSPGAGKPRARAIGRPLRGGANRPYRLHVVPVEREQRKPGASPPFSDLGALANARLHAPAETRLLRE